MQLAPSLPDRQISNVHRETVVDKFLFMFMSPSIQLVCCLLFEQARLLQTAVAAGISWMKEVFEFLIMEAY